jgi:hypothetical protein
MAASPLYEYLHDGRYLVALYFLPNHVISTRVAIIALRTFAKGTNVFLQLALRHQTD